MAQRFIIVRVGETVERVPLPLCSWCTDEAICLSCHKRAEDARNALKAHNPHP
jgi:hypothetical protein